MLMRTPRHPTPIGGKEKPKGNAKRILKNAGNGAKTVVKALGALFVGGIIVTSFSTKAPAQGSLKAPEIDPSKNIGLTIAPTGQPKNTYVSPGDTLGRAYADNMRASPDGEKKVDAGPDPSQKWCDGVEIKDGEIIFKGMIFGSGTGSSPIMSKEAIKVMKEIGIDYTKATNKNLKFFDQRIDGYMYRAYLIIEVPVIRENGPTGEIETSMLLVELNQKEDNVLVRPASFDTIFPGSAYIGKRGEFVAAAEYCIEILEPGQNGKKTSVTLSKLIGGDAPPMEAPTISEENGWYTITDPLVMKNSKGEQVKVVFKVLPEEDKFISGILPVNERIPDNY